MPAIPARPRNGPSIRGRRDRTRPSSNAVPHILWRRGYRVSVVRHLLGYRRSGGLSIWAVYVAVERSSSVVVTDDGVAIFARSEFNGRPRKFVALLPLGILTEPVERSRSYVHLPTYKLWLRRKEYEYLASAMPILQPNGQAARHPANFGSPLPGGVAPAGPVRPQRPQVLSAPSKRSDYPPLPTRNPEPGWQTIGNRFNDQWYWNGQEWTGHRRWVARQWVEDPPIH